MGESRCTFCDRLGGVKMLICFNHVRLRQLTGDYLTCGMCGEKNYCISRFVCDDCMKEFRDGLEMKTKFRCRICVMKGENYSFYNCKTVCSECYIAFEERHGMLGKTLPKSVVRQDRRCCMCYGKRVEYYLERCGVHI